MKKIILAALIVANLATPAFAGWNPIGVTRGVAALTSEVIFNCSDCGAPLDRQGHCTGGCK